MKKTINNYIVATIIWCLVLALLFSCNPVKRLEKKKDKAYTLVAADIPTKEKQKGMLAGWVLANFPPQRKVEIKDSIYIPKPYIDTPAANAYINNLLANLPVKECYTKMQLDSAVKVVVASIKLDAIKCPPCKQTTTTTTDIDTAGNWLRNKKQDELLNACNDSFRHYKNEYTMASNNLDECNKDLLQSENKKAKQWVWIISLIILLICSHILRNKLKF